MLLAPSAFGAPAAAAAAEPCAGASVFRIHDPPGDVEAPSHQVFPGFEELDILELNTCLVDDRIVSELRTRGPIAQTDTNVSYDVYVWHSNNSFLLRMYFSAGKAELEAHEGEGHADWAVNGSTLVMSVNRTFLFNTTGGWRSEASTSKNLNDGGGPYDRMDKLDHESTYVPGTQPPPGGSTPGFEAALTLPAVVVALGRARYGRKHRR